MNNIPSSILLLLLLFTRHKLFPWIWSILYANFCAHIDTQDVAFFCRNHGFKCNSSEFKTPKETKNQFKIISRQRKKKNDFFVYKEQNVRETPPTNKWDIFFLFVWKFEKEKIFVAKRIYRNVCVCFIFNFLHRWFHGILGLWAFLRDEQEKKNNKNQLKIHIHILKIKEPGEKKKKWLFS